MCQGLASLRGVGTGRILLAVLSASVSLAQTKADFDLDQYYRRMQCGEVSLAVILQILQCGCSARENRCLVRRHPGWRDGKLARRSGKAAWAEGNCLEANVAYLRRQNGPAIINYPSNHFCVFLGWKNGRAGFTIHPLAFAA